MAVSCGGGGADPVRGSFAPALPETAITKLNTDGVIFDGSLLDSREKVFDVPPGTTHFVVLDPPSGPSDARFRASCSAGSFYVDGSPVEDLTVTAGASLEWRAPHSPCGVQLLFEPVDSSSDLTLGMAFDVSEGSYSVNSKPISNESETVLRDPATGEQVVAASGELLVRLAPSTPITEVLNLRAENDYQVLERISAHKPVFRLKFGPDVDIETAWQELRGDRRLEVVEPNYIAYPAVVPDDPEYGQKDEFQKIDAEQAWDLTSGSEDVWVAVVDTGADRDHPDLAGNVVPGKDFITGGDGFGGETPGDGVDNNQDGCVDQNVGHGTHVSGIIAAEAFNGAGACGIAYNCSILPLRIFPTNGDTGATFSSIVEAVGYATEQPKVRVISMSIGTTYESSLLQDAINEAWNAGKVLVAAAANANTNQRYYPAAHDNVVAVAALNKQGLKASFSNYGDWVDISAYGSGIYSTYFNDNYAFMSGTSMACPLVSGCFALLFSFDGNLANEQAVQFLTQYSDDVDSLNPDYSGQLGLGIVNPFLALSALETNKPGQVGDGQSDGSVSDTDLELGPHAQG
jgi:thermitase